MRIHKDVQRRLSTRAVFVADAKKKGDAGDVKTQTVCIVRLGQNRGWYSGRFRWPYKSERRGVNTSYTVCDGEDVKLLPGQLCGGKSDSGRLQLRCGGGFSPLFHFQSLRIQTDPCCKNGKDLHGYRGLNNDGATNRFVSSFGN